MSGGFQRSAKKSHSHEQQFSVPRSDLLYLDALNRQMKHHALVETNDRQAKQKMEKSKMNTKSIVLLQANMRSRLAKILSGTSDVINDEELRKVFSQIGMFQEDDGTHDNLNDKRMLEELQLLNKVKVALDFTRRGVPLVSLKLFLEELVEVLLNISDIHSTINYQLIRHTISFIRANVSIKNILHIPSRPAEVEKEEEYSFVPHIDNKSKKMQQHSTEPRHQQLFNSASKSQKIKQQLSKKVLEMETKECTFKPRTNKVDHLKGSVVTGPIHDHLYSLHKSRKAPEVPSHIQPQLKECTFTPHLITKRIKKPKPNETPKGYAASIARLRYGTWSSVLTSNGLDEALQMVVQEKATQEQIELEHHSGEEEEVGVPSFLIEVDLGREGKKMIGIAQDEDHFQVIRQFALDFNLTPTQFFELLEKVTEALDTKT